MLDFINIALLDFCLAPLMDVSCDLSCMSLSLPYKHCLERKSYGHSSVIFDLLERHSSKNLQKAPMGRASSESPQSESPIFEAGFS